MSETTFDQTKAYLWGELYLDEEGEPHFICHTTDDNFPKTKDALIKFISLLQEQVDNERKCPFYDPKEAYRELPPGPARDIARGNAYPYDPSGPTRDWAHAAARGILADLCDRTGIKDELAKIDDNYARAEIVQAISSIIRYADRQRNELRKR